MRIYKMRERLYVVYSVYDSDNEELKNKLELEGELHNHGDHYNLIVYDDSKINIEHIDSIFAEYKGFIY